MPLALAVAIAAFVVFGPQEVPVAARRPPPADGYTNAVGAIVVGSSEPVAATAVCRPLDGVRVAGTEDDRAHLEQALRSLCAAELPEEVAARLRRFAQAGGVVRFAQFDATGVDSTADLVGEPPWCS